MSKAAPKKPGMLQFILLFAAVFFAMQLFFNPAQQNQDTRKIAEVNAEFQKAADAKHGDLSGDLQKFSQDMREKYSVLDKRFSGSPERFQAWNLMTVRLEDIGRSAKLKGDQFQYMEAAEKELSTFQRKSPVEYERYADTTRLPALHKDLDERYQRQTDYAIGTGYKIIDSLVSLTGRVSGFSYAFAMVLLAVVVRLGLWPLSNYQFRFFKQMKLLSPMVQALQERYKGVELQQRISELYKKYNLNPAWGCIGPMLPLPILIWLFSVMRAYRFRFEEGTFLWINPAWSHSTSGFFAPNLGHLDNVLLWLYAISMFVTQKMAVSDPTQMKQQTTMSIFMTATIVVMMYLYPLPSAFIFYWMLSNILATVQQVWVNKQPLAVMEMELPELPSGSNGKGTGVPKSHKGKATAKKRRR